MSHPARWLLLAAALPLSSCGEQDTTPPPTHTVEVTDTQYSVIVTYTTSEKFAYATASLPDFPESSTEREMLNLVNQERLRGGMCPLRDGGWRRYGPTSALVFEGHLHKAATLYIREIARRGTFDLSHRSALNQSVPAQRVVAAGFKPLPPNKTKMVFLESLAAQKNEFVAADVIEAWKGSPEHCAALFEPLFQRGYGAVAREGVKVGQDTLTYWALNTAGY